MFAALPFFGLNVWNLDIPGLGTLPIDPWATLVCLGFIAGMEIARHRAIRMGMDVRDVVDGAVVIVGMGFVVGHIVTVVGYHPERMYNDAGAFDATNAFWAIVSLWQGFSSFGGFLGAVIGAILFYKVLRPRPFWRYADVITYGFPFGWILGRMGCGVVHDHIGREAMGPYAITMNFDEGYLNFAKFGGDPYPWASGIRYELGLTEMVLFLGIGAAFWWLGRVDRPPGFFTGVLAVVYAPIRFGLDFLRNTDLDNMDARWGGLTPAQWGCFAMFVGGLYVLYSIDWKGFEPWPLDGSANQGKPRPEPEPDPAEATT